jgi:hypothetical protein
MWYKTKQNELINLSLVAVLSIDKTKIYFNFGGDEDYTYEFFETEEETKRRYAYIETALEVF